MEIINLPTFMLEKYDSTNEVHKNNARIFEEDDAYDEYMEPFWSLERCVNYQTERGRYAAVYFAYINGELVGVVGLIWIMDTPEIVIGIVPNKRGNHYSKTLIEEYTKYVFDTYKEYTEIYAHVLDENIHSVENVKAAGFIPLDDFLYVKKRY